VFARTGDFSRRRIFLHKARKGLRSIGHGTMDKRRTPGIEITGDDSLDVISKWG
jgi:hypothetical protein